MELLHEQEVEAKNLADKLLNLYRERVELDMLKFYRENALKEELASLCDIRNKNGEILPNKIKMPLVSALIDEVFLDKQNKKEEEYNLMEAYRGVLAGDKINKEVIDAYLILQESYVENNENIKEAFKSVNVLEKDMIDAIHYFAKEKYKEFLEYRKSLAGFDSKPPKDKTGIMKMADSLSHLLKERCSKIFETSHKGAQE